MRIRPVRLIVATVLAPLVLAAVSVPVLGGSAVAAPGPDTSSGPVDSAVSVTRTIRRTHLVDGINVEADKRTVTMSVSRTRDLRSRQPVEVTWSGAHPSGGFRSDINSPEASNSEFPFVVMQCRGVDSTSVPLAARISPETCWTQTGSPERQTQSDNPFPSWRLDRYAKPSERTFHVNDPVPLPAGCSTLVDYSIRRTPFIAVDGTTYFPDGGLCTKQPPESVVVDNLAQPGNTTYGITRPDGTGDTKFVVWSTTDNASLGCTQAVLCSLVAVPILGISCDVAAAGLPAVDRPKGAAIATSEKECTSTGNYAVGDNASGEPGASAVVGAAWWAESNWRNRIAVPLTVAPADNVCDIVGGKDGVDLYGSELMTQAMIQWRPTFCLDAARVPFRHVQLGEPQAGNLLRQGTIEAALLTNRPASGYGRRPVVNAPVALTGFAISYAIDDERGRRYERLRLTPRLLAKLLTMSYPGEVFVQSEFVAIGDNPLNISLDPEFQALNPAIKDGVANSVSASTILSLSSDSDVIRSLTTYMGADAATRAWLDGEPDPWGMRVNPSYRFINLPVATWPQLDTFVPRKYYRTNLNPCLTDNPVPFLPLIASPTIRSSSITYNIQFANSTSQTYCSEPVPGSTAGLKLFAGGRQSPGFRFVIGLTSLADAARYDLDRAELQTRVADGLPARFTSDRGRVFVGPSDDGLRSAAALLTADDVTGTWRLPVDRIVNDRSAATAYPGTMLVYAAVPTRGLPAPSARAYADLLSWMATTGQTPGTTNGTLPAGYLPLTEANGLGSQAAYTALAASAVADQLGALPSVLMRPAPVPTATPTTQAPTTPSRTAVTASPPATATPTTARPTRSAMPVTPQPSANSPVPITTSPLPVTTVRATPVPTTPVSATAAPAGTTAAPQSTSPPVDSSSTFRSGAGAGSTTNRSTTPQGFTAPSPFKPRLVAATPPASAAGPQAVAAGGGVGQTLSTLATEMGLAGSVPALILLAALLSGAAVAVTMLKRQLRGRRG